MNIDTARNGQDLLMEAQEVALMDEEKNPDAFSKRALLRYPGGKTRGVAFISSFFPAGLDTLLSPFFGGGSIELYMASKGTKVLGYDVFAPLVEFWECLFEDNNLLADKVERFYPLTKKQFYKLQIRQPLFKTKMERAAAYYVLNRSSFSGSTLSGGMSPGHPRFTVSSINRVRQFYNPNIVVAKLGFRETLEKHPLTFAYLDPPYLIKSVLYGDKGNTHRHFDHQGLATILVNRERWLLSYNDCEEIREMYAGHHIITPNWKYGMSNNKESKEVLIFSKDYKIISDAEC